MRGNDTRVNQQGNCDWPTCYGHLIVPDHVDGTTIEGYERPLEATKGWKEMLHRYAASLLGLHT
jgi:cytochrome c oxidase assembly protein subunit 15